VRFADHGSSSSEEGNYIVTTLHCYIVKPLNRLPMDGPIVSGLKRPRSVSNLRRAGKMM
jgi:hypothetical protein